MLILFAYVVFNGLDVKIADDNIIKFNYIVEIYDEDDEDYDDE